MPSPSPAPFILSSTAFADGGEIPRKYTCDGPDRSPPLSWVGAPTGTAAFAIVVDDPDANGWVHWVAFDIPGATTVLTEGASGTGGFNEGGTTWGSLGWRGPCPPSGTHRYAFELFALDRALGLGGATADELRRAMKGHVLGSAKLLGRYRRA